MDEIKINQKDLKDILALYHINQNVNDFTILFNGQDLNQENPQIKIIIRVNLDSTHYIVKIVKEKEHPFEVIEQQSKFSQCLYHNQLPTAKRITSKNQTYCVKELIQSYECCITLEEDLGNNELTFINEYYVKELANLMAHMHTISLTNHCKVDLNTIWNLFDDHSDIMRGFNQFKDFEFKYDMNQVNKELYKKIIKKYQLKKEELLRIWSKLPKAAVQGDFSTNNVILNEDRTIKGLIDYNIAGNEVLVNDLIVQAIFISYVMDLEEGLPETWRSTCFDIFVDTYRNKRKLIESEISVMNTIYQLVFPFLWFKMDKLAYLFKENKYREINQTFDEIVDILNKPYFSN